MKVSDYKTVDDFIRNGEAVKSLCTPFTYYKDYRQAYGFYRRFKQLLQKQGFSRVLLNNSSGQVFMTIDIDSTNSVQIFHSLFDFHDNYKRAELIKK